MQFRKTLIAGMAVSSVLAMVGVASATPSTDTIVQNQNFNFPLSPGQQSLQFDLFDDMGGTRELQMVEIFMNVTIGAEISATNDSTIDAEFFAVALSGNTQVSFGDLSAIALLSQVEEVPDDDLPVPSGETWDFGFVSDSDSASDSTMSNLNDFVGVGTINALVVGSGGFSVQGVADATLILADFAASGDVTVVYHYKTLVPAPGALALLGVAGLVGTRRRR